MRKGIRILMPVLVTLVLLVSAFAMATPVGAISSSSVVQTLGVNPSVTYADGTLYYTVTLMNLDIEGANDAVVDLVFYPPGPTGGAGALGDPVVTGGGRIRSLHR